MGPLLEFKNIMLLIWIAIGIVLVTVAIVLILKFIKKDNAMVSIEKYLKQKNFSKALAQAQKYMLEKPDDYLLKYNMALAYEGLGDYNNAISQFEKASVAASMSGEAAVMIQINLKIAELFSKIHKPKEALGYYVMVLDKQPKHSKALYEAGDILFGMGNFKKAREYLEILVKMKPDNMRGRYLLAKTSYKIGDMNSAMVNLQEVVKVLPKNDKMFQDASVLLSEVLFNLRRYEESVQVLNPLLNDKEMFQDALLKIVNILIRTNKYQPAIDLANRYMGRLNNEVKAQLYYQIASAYFKYGEVFQALELWQEAYKLKSDFMDLKEVMDKYGIILKNPKLKHYFTRSEKTFHDFVMAMLKLKFVNNVVKEERFWILLTNDASYVVYRLPYPLSTLDMNDIERQIKNQITANYAINIYTLFGFSKDCANHYLYRKINEYSYEKFIALVDETPIGG